MRTDLLLWLSLLPFCLINFSINTIVVTSHCLGHQQALLLNLKNNLVFNPTKSKKLIHWNQSADCCQWNGVSCNKGRVIALDLNQESISGGMENLTSLFSLKYLQSLNLAYNEFHSGIYSDFQNLKNLRYLNLSNAGFVGQVPYEISYLTKLETLDLSITFTSRHTLKLEKTNFAMLAQNLLDMSTTFTSRHTLKVEKPNIAMLVQNLTKIKELYLDGIAIPAKGKEWCNALSSLQNLQVLSMSFCNLSGPIDSSLVRLQSLSVLRLNQNNMSSPLPEFFVNLSSLTTLQLSGCGLTGMFPKNIFQVPLLEVLDLSDNLDLYGSLPNFSHQGSLHYLNLSHTNVSGSLPESIQNLRQLSTLDLSNCHLNGTLPISMSKLTQLVHLDLSFNNFIGPLPSFNMSKTLKYLSLYNNDLRGTIPSSYFEGLINLVSIDLGVNSLIGKVPSSLFTLPSLQGLMLSYNGFDGLLDEFPNASSSLLEILDLSGNNLQGLIPMSIFHLRRLRLLQLSSNKFNGTIQLDMIRRLQNLATLYLGRNNLSIDASFRDDHDPSPFPNLNNLMLASCKLKAFPNFLRNQSTLLYLDLSSNQIEGTIPNWIWRFDFMVYLNLSNNFLTDLEGPFQNLSSNLFLLDLHANQLQGPTPIFLKNVIYLDYSSNRFSSISPLDIGNHLPFTYFLSLSNNSFHGRIHESFCNVSNLRALDLSDNSFSGMIPKCLTSSSILRVLNLGGNKLEGHISDTFSTSCALRFLDLNGNLLGGTIPKSLANCQKLQVLNLGNNLLSDRFPCFLKSITTLRVMILRSNEFHGHIGCPNSIGNWETLQIVDLASNNFSGTLSAALLQSWKALMPDENEVGEQFGHLFFDIYDNVDPMHFKAAMSILNNDLKMKLAKLIAAEPPYVIDHLVSDVHAEDFGRRSFQDSVTIVNKGRQMKLVKILVAFTSLDFSSNHFEGPILEELMNFKALHALNLSQNAFSGHIPSSLGSLKYLESLDLSINSLSGEIPMELASLSFLSFMNLSYNHLVGKIPTGTQIQSFDIDSFKGNEGLCGPPLTQNCSGGGGQGLSPSASKARHSHTRSSIDWNFLSAELGFTFGFGLVILPLIFLKRWRLWYCKSIDDMLCRIIPQLDFVYECRGGRKYRTLRWRPY